MPYCDLVLVSAKELHCYQPGSHSIKAKLV